MTVNYITKIILLVLLVISVLVILFFINNYKSNKKYNYLKKNSKTIYVAKNVLGQIVGYRGKTPIVKFDDYVLDNNIVITSCFCDIPSSVPEENYPSVEQNVNLIVFNDFENNSFKYQVTLENYFDEQCEEFSKKKKLVLSIICAAGLTFCISGLLLQSLSFK